MRVAHIRREKGALRPDVELSDLAILQAHEVHLTWHPLDVTDPMTAYFDDFFTTWTGNIVDSKDTRLFRSE